MTGVEEQVGEEQARVAANRDAWNAGRYEAWVTALGPPEAEARRLVADPAHAARRVVPHLGPLAGKRIASIQGSNGRIAVALALMGAQAWVFDFAEENRRYALALAAAAGVQIDYRLGDVMQAGGPGLDGTFDGLAMELGILHYHTDIQAFFSVLRRLAAPGARLVLAEFHPVQRKLFWGGRGTEADYFAAGAVIADVPDPTGAGDRLGRCALRFWTLGEIVTAVIAAGFTLRRLEEHPDWDDPTIPGTFTLVADG